MNKIDTNAYFWFILVAILGVFLLELISSLLNLRALSATLPDEFRELINNETYQKSQSYTQISTRFNLIRSTLSLLLLIGFWFIGGFQFIDQWIRGFELNSVLSGLIMISLLLAANYLILLPFSLYDTFIIEENFGFNQSTLSTFITDQFKGLILSALIGLPVLALLLFLFEHIQHAWLWGWISLTLVSLALTYIAPTWLMPLFNKFSPLEDGELKEAIIATAKSCDFPLAEVMVMDGSKRSSKSNAFFTGFGNKKRIVLFDTLIKNHSTAELVGVLAHEIGHYKKKHLLQGMLMGIITTGIMFFALGRFLNNSSLFAAFGVDKTSIYLSLIFFGLLFQPFSTMLSILSNVRSRHHEYQADAYAAQATGSPDDLAQALKKLSKDNLSNLSPHPLYVFLHYSHPPVLKRISALRN
jgi:STE24 endopeptidase